MFDPVMAAVRELAGVVAGTDLWALSDNELSDLVGAVERARRGLDATLAHAVGRLDSRGATEPSGWTTANWMAVDQHLPRGECSALVRCGGFLHRHPVLDDALRSGAISFAHVRVLERLATPRVEHVIGDAVLQRDWVELAGTVRFEVWRQAVTAAVELADADGGHDPRPEDTRGNGSWGLNGDWHLDLTFGGRDAVEAEAHLNAEADALFHRFRRDRDATGGELTLPSRAQLLARAALELFRKGRAAGNVGAGPVADVTLVVRTPEGLPEECCRPAEGQSDGDWLAGLLVTTLDGMPVRKSVARVLSCDPLFRTHVENHHGEVLDHGRAHRHATPAQRRAAGVRFGGCCFPGCTAPMSWCDMHHVREWDGHHGPSDQANFAPLCRHHHGVAHREGWGMRSARHGFDFTTATGQVLPCQARGRPAKTEPDRPPDRLLVPA